MRRRACGFFPQLAATLDTDSAVIIRLPDSGSSNSTSVVGVAFSSVGAAFTMPTNVDLASTQAEAGVGNLQLFLLEQASPVITIPSVSMRMLHTPSGAEFLSADVMDRWQIPRTGGRGGGVDFGSGGGDGAEQHHPG